MADGRQFGTIINERRLELGYSLGQFANRIGTTAAQVRAWERGDEVPDDATVGRIAGELDLPGAPLRETLRAGRTSSPPPRSSEPPAVTFPVFSDSGDTAAAEPDDPDTGGRQMVDQPTEAVPIVPAPPPSYVPEQPPLVSPEARRPVETGAGAPVQTGGAQTGAAQTGAAQTGAAARGSATAAGAMPPRPTAAVTPTVTPGRVMTDPGDEGLFAGWNRALRILFDPDKRYLFWARTVLTILVMLIFLRVLAWAVPAFFDVLSDILDTIESTETDPNLPGFENLPEGGLDSVTTSLPDA